MSAFFGKVGTLNISIKTTLAILAASLMMQGCAAVGPAVGLLAIGATTQNAAKEADWSSRVERMNCTQLRDELTKLKKRSGFVAGIIPGNYAATNTVLVKDIMRQKGCRIPA